MQWALVVALAAGVVWILASASCVVTRRDCDDVRNSTDRAVGACLALSCLTPSAIQNCFPAQPLYLGTVVGVGLTGIAVGLVALRGRDRETVAAGQLGLYQYQWLFLVAWWAYVTLWIFIGDGDPSVGDLMLPAWAGVFLVGRFTSEGLIRRGVYPVLTTAAWLMFVFLPWSPQQEGENSGSPGGPYLYVILEVVGLSDRYRGMLGSPQQLGMFCLLLAAVALQERGRRQWVALVPAILLSLLSSARGPQAALVLLLGWSVVVARGVRTPRAVRMVGVASLALLATALAWTLVRGIADGSTLSGTGRVQAWMEAVRQFSEAPVLGQVAVQGANPILDPALVWVQSHVHNTLLQVSWEFGLLGVAIWSLWIQAFVRFGWRERSRPLLVAGGVAALLESVLARPFAGLYLLLVVLVMELARWPIPASTEVGRERRHAGQVEGEAHGD